MSEPLIHSHESDCLPDNHRLANSSVYCSLCKMMVHAFNNECMAMWVETGLGNYCIDCFYAEVTRADYSGFYQKMGLPDEK